MSVETPSGTRSAQRATTGGGVISTPAPVVRRRRARGSWRNRIEIAVLTVPALAMFLLFVIFPVIAAAYYGFFHWTGYGVPTEFVGLQNYVTILQDPTFIDALKHNAFIVLFSLLLQGPIAVLLALLL